MLLLKSMFCQQLHLLQWMAHPKAFRKDLIPTKGSFGGFSQPGLAIPTGASCSSGQRSAASDNAVSSLISVSARMSFQDEEFPPLGSNGTSSRAPPAKSLGNIQREGSINTFHASSQRLPNQNFPMSSKLSSDATSSRNFHHGIDQDDDWADEEGAVSQSRRKKQVSVRKQPSAGGGGERTAPSQDRIYHLGRLLTSILRHRAADYKLIVRNDGYVVVNDILKLTIRTRAGIPLSAYTVDDILKAVERDNKQRFSLLTEDNVLLIRANQGHSIATIETEKLLKPIVSAEEIPVCVHGTLMRNLDSIMKTGLKKMGRNHVHFASGLPREDGVISGMRFTSEVLIYLDAKKALQDGMKLYISDNGVILTEGFEGIVPPQYFAKVVRWKNGKITPMPFQAKTGST